MFIWLLEALQKYNIFGVVSFLLPFVLFCYHAFRMKQNKVEKIERERYVEEHESEEASAEKNEASSSSDEEDVDETDAKTIDLTKTNYFHSSNLICDESFEANSESNQVNRIINSKIIINFFFWCCFRNRRLLA